MVRSSNDEDTVTEPAGASDCGRTDPGKGTSLSAGRNPAWNRSGD